jgi:hypothetical protein
MRRVCSIGIAGFLTIVPTFQVDRLEAQVSECARSLLSPRPRWSISAAWNHNGRELLIVDNTDRSILRYSTQGQPLGEIRQSWGGLAPSLIKPHGSGFLIGLAQNTFVEVDNKFVPRGSATIFRDPVQKGRNIASAFQWHPAGDDLVTFSDIRIETANATHWQFGFLRFPRAKPEGFVELLDVQQTDPTRIFYRLGHPYIAAIGKTAFFLSMRGSNIEIFQNKRLGEPDLLSVSGLNLGATPKLPSFRNRTDYPAVMKAVESSRMPTGLFGWEGFLYVLIREPTKQGTQWSLTKVDTQKRISLGTKVLKTQANHLTVAPGLYQWAFLEKGPVLPSGQSFGSQEIGRMLLVPAYKFREWGINEKLCE